MSSHGRRRRRSCAALLALTTFSGFAFADAAPRPGAICIAPFHVARPAPGDLPLNEPLLSATTWSPQADSVFEFRIDKRLEVLAHNDELVAVPDLPLDRKVLVEVRLDGKPFEAFRLDLATAPGHRVCLWLYPGYWHWIDNGWSPELGCTCGESGAGSGR